MKKFVLILFIAVSLILNGACSFSEFFDHSILDNDNEDVPENKDEDESPPLFAQNFTLARYGGEKLNPYTSASRTNRDLLSICYEGLVFVNKDMTAVPAICEYFETDGRTATFYISENAYFSDGTRITASDCVYSYSRADGAESVYKNRFGIITGYSEIDEMTFRVWFSTDNIYNINLTNIPIIKAGSDVSAAIPVGSGAYAVARDTNEIYLIENEYYTSAGNGIEIISLIDVYDSETLLYNINYGKIHASYADLSDGNSSYRGNIELVNFTTNTFVFAVVNRNSAYFSDISSVKALTYAVRRQNIVDEILSGSSKAVWYPFNPDWKVTSDAALNNDIYSAQTAHEYFTNAGLTLSGTVRVFSGKPAELVILVNQESLTKVNVAESVASDLEGLGFSVTVRALASGEFRTAALAGSYDILIAETTLFPNMDISVILNSEIVRAAIYKPAPNVAADYSAEFLDMTAQFYTGETDMRTFLSVFQNELPFIPLYFSGGALAVNRSVRGTFSPGSYGLFSGISGWEY